MEELIKKLLSEYPQCVLKAELFHTSKASGDEARTTAQLDAAKRKVEFIDTLLNSLKEMEQFVIRYRLIEGMTWPQVLKEGEKQYGQEARFSQSTLSRYQKNALKKITELVLQYRELTMQVFAEAADFLSDENI